MSINSPSSKSRRASTMEREETSQVARRFVGSVAVVTGANERGIGGAVAERLMREGASVSLLSMREPIGLLRSLEKIEGSAIWTRCDVREQSNVDQAIDATVEEYGGYDVLINNSGVERAAPFSELNDDDWTEMLEVNLSGVMRLTRASLPWFENRGEGVIVNIASAAGIAGTPGLVGYSATKAGVIGLTQSLAQELAQKKIRVVAIAPALVNTPMSRPYVSALTAETWEEVQRSNPLGIGTPEDVASAVAFLASSEARWITGVTLPMGWLPAYPLPLDKLSSGE